MMRAIIALTVLIAAGFCLMARSSAQVGFDRRGHDYMSFPVRPGDPAVCAARCDREARCRAWSFNFPTAERAGMCWLKSQVPPRVEAGDSASGVRGAGVIEPHSRNREFAIDRPGGDYRTVEVPAEPNGEACRAACEGDNQCRAWTYMRPGYGETGARCYLKNRLTPPRHRPCCISGVER
jgi:PAN domain